MKKQILVVEDERIVADDIKASLLRLGYDVCGIAISGEQSIKKAGKLRPDLVLMDIVLKGEMDGIESASIIRTHFDIPVVYLTAHADDKTLERAKTTEPSGYILKPFEDGDVHSTIEIAIYKHKIVSLLKESEERYSSVVENAHDAIYIMTRGDLQYVNPAFEKLTGFKGKELFKNEFNLWKIIHPDDLKSVKEKTKTGSIKRTKIRQHYIKNFLKQWDKSNTAWKKIVYNPLNNTKPLPAIFEALDILIYPNDSPRVR